MALLRLSFIVGGGGVVVNSDLGLKQAFLKTHLTFKKININIQNQTLIKTENVAVLIPAAVESSLL